MRRKFSIAAVFLYLASAAQAQQKGTDSSSSGTEAKPKTVGVYYAAFRTSAHIARSSPEIFHGVSQDLLDYLKSKSVRIVADPERGVLETSDQISTESMMRLAKLAGASGLLLVTVDRPAASWLKITVQSFDESGKQLWEESADKKSGLNGKSAPHDVGEKIKSKLQTHIGREGLPVDTAGSGSSSSSSYPGSSTQTAVLARNL
jgi:hypothetical protein